jgi:alpha-glucosidase
MRRKYPNLMSNEGARGMEYNAWSSGNPPSHTLVLPFTRILGGPLDYTPGIFYIKWKPQRLPESDFKEVGVVHTTRARQLALYVLIFSGVQMVTDLPEHYNIGHNQGLAPEFEFIREVPVAWDETKVLAAEIGEFAVIARRSAARWFLGAGTDDVARKLNVPLTFLGSGTFIARIFADGQGADFETNPEPVSVTEREVTASDSLEISMGRGGGQAVIFRPK